MTTKSEQRVKNTKNNRLLHGKRYTFRELKPFIIYLAPLLLFLIIILLTYTKHTMYGVAPTVRNMPYAKLHGDTELTQTFQLEAADLVGIEVLLFAQRLQIDTPVVLTLSYADKGTDHLPPLAEVAVPIKDLKATKMTAFWFEPIKYRLTPSGNATNVKLTIAAPELGEADWVVAIAGPDTYPHGTLQVNGEKRENIDLSFRPIYQQRLIDSIIPVTKLIYGKQGLLAWPLLYPLIIFFFVYLLTYLASILWREVL
jgi:hypothetical protein